MFTIVPMERELIKKLKTSKEGEFEDFQKAIQIEIDIKEKKVETMIQLSKKHRFLSEKTIAKRTKKLMMEEKKKQPKETKDLTLHMFAMTGKVMEMEEMPGFATNYVLNGNAGRKASNNRLIGKATNIEFRKWNSFTKAEQAMKLEDFKKHREAAKKKLELKKARRGRKPKTPRRFSTCLTSFE